jgi:hypothetical protein
MKATADSYPTLARDGLAADAQALPERSDHRRTAAAQTNWPARLILTLAGYLMPR